MIAEFKPPTLPQLTRRFGAVPAHRIRLDRFPATEADVLHLHETEKRLFELVDGVLLEKPMGFQEGYLASWIATLLNNFVVPHDLGIVAGADAIMRIAPGLVRIPDVSFVSWDQLPSRHVPKTPIPEIYPDLAVEVLSESNSIREMQDKYQNYFNAGTRLVWEVDSSIRTVTVYTDPQTHRTLRGTQKLRGGVVLPGFSISVQDIFAKLAPVE